MERLSPLPYRQVARKLHSAGFVEVSQKGSHVKFVRRDGHEIRTAVVPRHREVRVGTLSSVLRQAGLSVEQFNRL
ncbi:MAG: type II toxin-antitoxin system HicA family toxin [Acidimicrobiia bacterium]|nr:type II toxin-antitoxin system HicA family toxin [Acidimicrobiia bacterium]MYF83824.1 type II toxin-antitoxin system HicA family toxin [Acidimicrobiia bacterium]